MRLRGKNATKKLSKNGKVCEIKRKWDDVKVMSSGVRWREEIGEQI